MPIDLYIILLLFRELLNISKLQSKQSMNEILGIFPDMSDGGLSTSVPILNISYHLILLASLNWVKAIILILRGL